MFARVAAGTKTFSSTFQPARATMRSIVGTAMLLSTALGAPNPNCEARGKCISVGPGTKYPEQNTLCLGDSKSGAGTGAWHCAKVNGAWGAADHTFGPGSAMDLTMIGGSPTAGNLNETFTVHATDLTTYGECPATGAKQWEITRELSFLDGTTSGGCKTRVIEGARLLATFLHNCTVLTEITIEADADGSAQAAGCRCCTKCTGAPCLEP